MKDANKAKRTIADQSAPTGVTYWRSLDELGDTPAFREWVNERFPRSMRELLDGAIDRRQFLYLMAASLGLAGLSGCRRPEIEALPYSKPPEEVIPGLPTFYATAMPRNGLAVPVLVESHEGRPTKIEGNPRHPDSEGTSDCFAQASVLDLYDPDRSRSVLHNGVPSNWAEYDTFATDHFAKARASRGRGLSILAEDIPSPALNLLRAHLKLAMSEARWFTYEPISGTNVLAGSALAFDPPGRPRYFLDRAAIVLALDSDFLGLEDEGGRQLRGFSAARQVKSATDSMNRLYAVESRYSLTGGMADHRFRLASSQVIAYVAALAKRVLAGTPEGETIASALAQSRLASTGRWQDSPWVNEVAADLKANAGGSLIIAGRHQPPLVHALAHAMNVALGNVDKTFELREVPPEPSSASLVELVRAIEQGQIETLLILGGNPAYNAPAELDFAGSLKQVKTTIRLGLHADETSSGATWHLPAAHYLESWGDARASDGSVLAIQPLIEPLFGGRTALEIVARLSAFETTSARELVRLAFRQHSGLKDAELDVAWQKFLHEGWREGSAYPVLKPRLQADKIAAAVAKSPPTPVPPTAESLELVFERDATVDDGRFANNGWLQELPDPITKLAWDNAVVLSPKTADAFHVSTGDVVSLDLAGRTVEVAALVLPGQADFSVSLSLGYGRTVAGRVGRGVGFNAYALRTTAAPDIAIGLKLARTGRRHPLACTQDHFTMQGRDLVRELTLEESRRLATSTEREDATKTSTDLITHPPLTGEHQWGMVIDLNKCVGCNACTIACQSENNIPIVGKDEVIRGREMHWIRIDRYFSGTADEPELVHQPVACVQCESAPCEVVCPVNATVHSDEGLNVQVYSRCIGTRYCLNNCPYKVRRFNFFNYNERPLDQLRLGPLAEKGMAETLKMQKNPDVTVRIRGVMEKCTYCVQRIERAKIGAKVEAGASGNTAVVDGTIVPACAQACPARAIVFGDISDPESRVSKLKAEPRDYALLGELNTRPRTTYLARLRNPNPNMPAAGRERA
jgi:molybdopterin-containing oxidoreductase family iron-sulfur binding subunit